MLTHNDLLDLCLDLCAAEQLLLPGPARQAWVIASQTIKRAQSPPPVWIWFATLLLEKLIPILLEWIKARYGTDWTAKIHDKLKAGQLPWE